MGVFAQVIAFMGFWETLAVTGFCIIGAWLLTSGREWFKREQKFLKNTTLFDVHKSVPLIGNVLTFACNYHDVMGKIVELTPPEGDE